jgi:hypothetical protein
MSRLTTATKQLNKVKTVSNETDTTRAVYIINWFNNLRVTRSKHCQPGGPQCNRIDSKLHAIAVFHQQRGLPHPQYHLQTHYGVPSKRTGRLTLVGGGHSDHVDSTSHALVFACYSKTTHKLGKRTRPPRLS